MKILFIDGMGSPGNIWRELAIPLKTKFPKLDCVYSQWFEWKMNSFKGADVVVGHSLGGDSAVRYSLENNVKLTVLCAARYQTDVKAASLLDWGTVYDPAQVMKAPNSVTHNFWTYGPLPSAPCEDAVENVNVGRASLFMGLVGIGHGNTPAAPEVFDCVADFIRSQAGKSP